MCFIAALINVSRAHPVIVAANRDELRTRPSLAPFRWPGRPTVWAGRDEAAGGTWLGVNEHGVLVAVTNRRPNDATPEWKADRSLPSRGQLALSLLRESSAAAAATAFDRALAASVYNPFNLVVASPAESWSARWHGDRRPLKPGAHFVTSRGDIDTPDVAAIRRARILLDPVALAAADLAALNAALTALCADREEPEPICRVGGEYGTVSSSIIALRANGSIAEYLHASGPPCETPYAPVPLT